MVKDFNLFNNAFINADLVRRPIRWAFSANYEHNFKPQIYNANWPSSTKGIFDLDSIYNINYTHSISLKAGISYQLKFQYAPKQAKPLDTSAMKGYWNGANILNIVPSDFNVHTYETQVTAIEGNNAFRL